MQPVDDSTRKAPGKQAMKGPDLSSDQTVSVRPDTEVRSSTVEGAAYTDDEEALVQERLKNLGYL